MPAGRSLALNLTSEFPGPNTELERFNTFPVMSEMVTTIFCDLFKLMNADISFTNGLGETATAGPFPSLFNTLFISK